VLGATIPIDTLDGRVALKVPPGMVAEQSLRLRGKGLPAEDGTRGHLYAVVAIQVPPHPTPEEEALWKKLAATSAFNPRNPS
jgi:curved DNA-binding protein